MRFIPGMLILLLFPLLLSAQENKVQPPDTAKFYKDLYRYSKERKFAYRIYKAVFNVPKDPVNATINKQDGDETYPKNLECRIIRTIRIETLEPFGYSLTDTTKHSHSFIQKTGNALHFKTQRKIVRNYLLFNEGDELNLLQVVESERLVRKSEFIRDAKITVVPVAGTSDSVDIVVTTQDLWTFSPRFTLTESRVKFRFTEYNFFGLGHRFSNNLVYNYAHPSDEPLYTEGSYLVPNIANTYISAEAVYRILQNDQTKGLAFNRPFYSTLSNWAGGFGFVNRTIRDSIEFKDTGFEKYNYDAWISSAWIGRSFVLKTGPTIEEHATKGVVSGAYTRTRYGILNPSSANLTNYFVPVDLYLVSFGITNRKYFTDRYIFRFGEKEDVPTGRLLEVTTGAEQKGKSLRNYFDVSIGTTNYIGHSGYLSTRLTFSTFISGSGLTQGLVKADLFAFSRLFTFRQAKIRWFGYSNFLYGIKRNEGELISLRYNNGISGFKSVLPEGTSRFTVNMRVLFFNRLEWLGFRVTPVLLLGVGMVGDKETPIYNARVYKGFGAGVAVTNVYLVKSNFEILIGFYPGIGAHELRFNPVNVWSFQFQDYAFDRPSVITFD